MAAIANAAQHAERAGTNRVPFHAGLEPPVLDADGAVRLIPPELHYMRGPGPKWHAKHAPAAYVSTTLAPRPHVFERVKQTATSS